MERISLSQIIYALDVGGSETLARRLALGLRRRGRYACSIYAVHYRGPLADLLKQDGIPCRAFGRTGKWDVGPLLRLVRQFRSDRTRLVHTHHIGQLLYGGLAARLAGCRLVHTEHDYYSITRPRAQQLLRLLTPLADRITAVAEPIREFLRDRVGIPAHKLVTIQNGVEIERFERASPADRALLGIRDRDAVVACVARLSPEKGHAVLLDAFRLVLARHPDARLLIIGEGDEQAGLERRAADLALSGRVQWLGLRSDVPELLAAADVFVLPSLQEGFPMVVLEALAAGKAVVATEVGAISKVVRDGENGLLVPPGDARALAGAIGYLLHDPALRRRLGDNGRALVREHFDFEATVTRYDEVYRSVLSETGRLPRACAPAHAADVEGGL